MIIWESIRPMQQQQQQLHLINCFALCCVINCTCVSYHRIEYNVTFNRFKLKQAQKQWTTFARFFFCWYLKEEEKKSSLGLFIRTSRISSENACIEIVKMLFDTFERETGREKRKYFVTIIHRLAWTTAGHAALIWSIVIQWPTEMLSMSIGMQSFYFETHLIIYNTHGLKCCRCRSRSCCFCCNSVVIAQQKFSCCICQFVRQLML